MQSLRQVALLLVFSCGTVLASLAQGARVGIESPKHRAWDMLQNSITSKHAGDRADGVRALGLIRDDIRARESAEDSLQDKDFKVRAAAATALGQMHATESIPKLQHALADKSIPVVMAAAQSLRELKETAPAYALYYDLLTGERKSSDGMIAQGLKTLKDPKQLAMIGVSEGVGFIPFADIGWGAYRAMHKKDPNPVRAIAATNLAHDPDPATGRALVKATRDKNWIVRSAAIGAISERGDSSLAPKIEPCFSDKNSKVRYSAAAAVIHLSSIDGTPTARNGKKRSLDE